MLTPIDSTFKRKLARCLSSLAAPLFFAAAAAGAAGCGDDDDKPGALSAPSDGCSRGVMEADLSNDDGSPASAKVAWHGPGADEAGALKKGNYVFSSTYLRMKAGPQTLARVQEVSDPIITDFQSRPGLVAFAFSSSDSCNATRTFTAWESEEAMYDFVSADAHRAAMAALGEVSRGGSAVTHWSGAEAEGTWTRGLTELGSDRGLD